MPKPSSKKSKLTDIRQLARAKTLSPEQRKGITEKATRVRWQSK